MSDEDAEYPDLATIISFKNFDFSSASHRNQEVDILQPQLEKLGYRVLAWKNGELDSFGPLTRLCETINPDGNKVTFIYG